MKKLLLLAGVLATLLFALTFAGCGDSREKVIIYTSAEDFRVAHMKERLQEQFPQYNIIVEYKSSGAHATALKASGKNTECDITHDLEYAYAAQIEKLGYLADLTGIVDQSLYTDDAVISSRYVPTYRNGGAIIVNPKVLEDKGLPVPTSYEDLLDPKYKDLISMPQPKSSGTGYMFLLSMVNNMGESEALSYFDKLSKNVLSYTTSGSGPVTALVRGEVAIGLGMTFQAVQKINENVDLDILFFEEGSPYSFYGQGIVAGKETRQAVKEVFAFLATTVTEEQNERFCPERIFKNKADVVLPNYPTEIVYADMTVENMMEYKEALLKKWTH